MWALNRMKLKIRAQPIHVNNKKGTNTSASTTSNNQRPHMVVWCTKGLSESLMNVCSKHRIKVYFTWGKTIRSLLLVPKDKDLITKKGGVIYRYKCDRVECDEEYIGRVLRNIWGEVQRTPKEPFPNMWPLYIRVKNPSVNKSRGKYHLPPIWMSFHLTPQT